jgi:hypothetical protein
LSPLLVSPESPHPIRVTLALHCTSVPQGVQVCNGLAHGKSGLVHIECAWKQNRDRISRTHGLSLTSRQHISQTLAVVLVQLVQALMQTHKRLAV